MLGILLKSKKKSSTSDLVTFNTFDVIYMRTNESFDFQTLRSENAKKIMNGLSRYINTLFSKYK